MAKIHEKFKTYYGELLHKEEIISKGIIFSDWEDKETAKFITDLSKIGINNIFIDVEEGNDYSDTLFFEINQNTDLKALLLLITSKCPHEFDEITPNCFRMWFD